MINCCEVVRELVGIGGKLILLKPPTTLSTTFAVVSPKGFLVDYVDMGCANECLEATLPDSIRMKLAGAEIDTSDTKTEKVWCMVM